ncbi:MAG TPA: tRNA pseudouridine(55) synthase TruB [Clostridia bacterium]|nr:tRNA pseudouridine(55) synthase TruB [Clostridia bacterium]
MNGIINVLKPPGMTSHDVVGFMRKVLGMKKIGHTGTLDPEAAGVLPICTGKATKVAQYLTDKQKRYRANIRFGAVTDTCDSYGSIIRETGPVSIDPARLEAVLKGFLGTISQKPPIYSALKVNGKKLYEYAREGKEVNIEERPVEIYEIKLVAMLAEDEAMLDVYCSKGTYIRTLCYDIGEALGCGAYMSQLVRLESSPFTIEEAHTLEEIKTAASENRLEEIMQSVEVLFRHYKTVTIKASALQSVMNGNPLFGQGIQSGFGELAENDRVSIASEEGFLGIGMVEADPQRERLYIRIKKLFV